MEHDLQLFAQRLKALRREKKRTQKEMALFLEKTERHYQDIEAGKVNIPSLMLLRLADYFGVSADYLLGRTENREVNRSAAVPAGGTRRL